MTFPPGRPKSPNARRNVRSIHLSDDELAAVESAALASNQPLTAWMREKVVKAAKRK